MDFIQDLDIKCSHQEFVDSCNSLIDGNYTMSEQATKQGKTLLQLTYENEDNNSPCTLLVNYDKATDVVHMTPFRLSSTNYVVNHDSQLHAIFDSLALAKGGTFIGSTDGSNAMIINGKSKPCEHGLLEKGTRPTVKDIEQDSSSIGFTIKRTIKEYLAEEPELKDKLAGVKTQVDLLNTVARYVLNKRVSGEMDYDDFLDLFRQACLLGANDPTVLKFYKIVKI